MRTPIDIIADLDILNLRKHTGTYTFGFEEDNVKFCYHRHSTGRHLDMWLLDPHGIVSPLYVYYNTEWFSSRYNFNEKDKVQGFQVDGPWVAKINIMLEGFEAEIQKEKQAREEAKIAQANQKKIAEQEKLDYYKNIT